MAALPEIDRLLSRITPAKLGVEVARGGPVAVAAVTDSATLVLGIFSYSRRAIGVPGRLLTTGITRQPALALEEGDRVTPLVYAEDVVGHPLRDILVRHLETLLP